MRLGVHLPRPCSLSVEAISPSSCSSPAAAGNRQPLAGFIPDCLVPVSRLIADERVSRRRKLLLAALAGYLALPFDLVPDFIPVAGQLDDVFVVAFVLRRFLRSAGDGLVREHWPGPEQSLRLVVRVAGA